MDEEMGDLVSRLAEYLRTSEQQLRCFHEYKSQVEGWFKGELICFLDQEKRAGRLPYFERERLVYDVLGRRKNIDIALQFDKIDSSRVSWVELKHWHIGTQNNGNYGCRWYFRHATQPDVEKLLMIPEDGDKFILVLLTMNPGSKDWTAGVEAFNAAFPQLSVCSLTNPGDYPDYFFLGLLHVPEGGQR